MVKSLQDIVTEMCSFVGVKYSDVDFNDPNWYCTHSWTKEQEKEFTKWLEGYIWANKKQVAKDLANHTCITNKKQVHQLAQEIILMWGWTTVE